MIPIAFIFLENDTEATNFGMKLVVVPAVPDAGDKIVFILNFTYDSQPIRLGFRQEYRTCRKSL